MYLLTEFHQLIKFKLNFYYAAILLMSQVISQPTKGLQPPVSTKDSVTAASPTKGQDDSSQKV